MRRGTTPTVTFKIKTELDLTTVSTCFVTFKSILNGRIKEYDMESLIVDPEERTITVAMSQEDTLFFNEGPCRVQIRLKTNEDLAYASNIYSLEVKPVLKEGVI